jgi:hypothetical protein
VNSAQREVQTAQNGGRKLVTDSVVRIENGARMRSRPG